MQQRSATSFRNDPIQPLCTHLALPSILIANDTLACVSNLHPSSDYPLPPKISGPLYTTPTSIRYTPVILCIFQQPIPVPFFLISFACALGLPISLVLRRSLPMHITKRNRHCSFLSPFFLRPIRHSLARLYENIVDLLQDPGVYLVYR